MKRIGLFWMACLIISGTLYAQDSLEQRLKLVPPETKLVSEKDDSVEEMTVFKRKYNSQSSQLKVLQFYRHLFRNEGFTEQGGFSDNPKAEKLVYFFVKQNTMLMLNFLKFPDRESTTTYYLTLYRLRKLPKVQGAQ
jgi:hypothetical protein